MLVEIQVECPHCGEVFPIQADTSEGDFTTIEDCTVCCRPMEIRVSCQPGEVEDVSVGVA